MNSDDLPVLVLTLRHKYFDEIKQGMKNEEYRLYKHYWKKRLCNKKFKAVIVTDGKTRWSDVDKWMLFPWNGYELRNIHHDEFGPDPVIVFAIKLER